MTESPSFLAERLLTEGQKTIDFFEELTPQNWDQVIYTDGTHWTPLQILAHFISSEISLARLVENISSGGSGSPENFDIDAYNERKVSELIGNQSGISKEELLARLKFYRQETARLVGELDPDDLKKQGRHPFLGYAPLAEIIKIIYRHNQIHQREIRHSLSQKT